MSDLTANAAPAASSKRRRRRLLFGIIVLLAMLIAVLVVAYRWSVYESNREVREVTAELDASDPGWRFEELQARRQVIPENENSAQIVLTARAQMPVPWPTPRGPNAATADWHERLDGFPPEVQLGSVLVGDLRAELAAAQKALGTLRRLRTITAEGRYPLTIAPDWASTRLASFADVETRPLLEWDTLLLGQDGDADGALASSRGLLALGRSIGDEPFLISQARRSTLRQGACRCVERVLAESRPSAAALKITQELMETEAAYPLTLNMARAYRADLHAQCEAVKDGRLQLSSFNGRPNSIDTALLNLRGPTLVRHSQPFLERLGTGYVAAAKLPPEQQRQRLAELDEMAQKKRGDRDIPAAYMTTNMGSVSNRAQRAQAVLYCTLVALAVERFRSERDRWPGRLLELAPNYLKAVPLDPFDGKPLRYKRLADGVIVYSVGPDGQDNGGALNRKSSVAEGTDLGFRLWDPAQRRQPPAELLPPPDEDE